jgi:hypothetical protein
MLGIALLALGCSPRSQSPVAPVVATAPNVHPVTPAPASAVATAVAVATAPQQLFPEGTAMIVNLAGIGALLGIVDLEALMPKIRPFYDQGATFLTSTFGANLLDPNQWPQVGIDPKGPMGAALVDARSTTIVLYATVADRERLRGFVDRVASPQRLSPVFEDRGVVLKTEDERSPALVLRDGFVFLVITDRPEAMVYDIARQLASVDPARALTATPRYQQAIAGGVPGAGLTAYLDLSAFLESEELQLMAAMTTSEPSWPERELELATGRGAPPEELDRLRQQIDSDREYQRRNFERRTRGIELGKRWLAGVSPIVFEFTGSLSGVTGTIRAKMPETAPMRGILRNASEPSPVLMALGERPALMYGASLDLPIVLAEFEALLRSDGGDLDKAYRELGELLRVADPRREMLAVLSGTGGFALTISEALLRGDGSKDTQELGFVVGLGVKDTGRAEALLAAIWKKIPGKVGKDPATGAYTLEESSWRKIHAKVVAQQLVVTTDAGLIQRVAAGDRKTTAKWLQPAAVPVVNARDAAMQGLLDPVAATLLISGRSSSYYYDSNEANEPLPPYWLLPDVPREQFDKVPRSAAYKAQMREWKALSEKIRKRTQAQGRSQAQTLVELARCIGVLTGNLREQPDGLVLTGGQLFGKGGLARAIELAATMTSQRPGRDEVLDELLTTRSQLMSEMHRVRVRDVAAKLNVPMPPS